MKLNLLIISGYFNQLTVLKGCMEHNTANLKLDLIK